MRYSAFPRRLLLPPMTRPVAGSRGPTLRMSKPRMLYSPPRNSFSKMGRIEFAQTFAAQICP
jgi:hypothetical protein